MLGVGVSDRAGAAADANDARNDADKKAARSARTRLDLNFTMFEPSNGNERFTPKALVSP